MKYLIIPLILIAILQACYYDKEELLYMSVSNCDTSNVTYTKTISPIISTYCLGCHATSTHGNAGTVVILETYENLKVYVDNGKFWSSVIQDGNAVFMPQNAGKLGDCKLNQIDIWIKAGAPNN